VLEGRLGDFTLPDILRLLAFTAKSGRLWVSGGGVEARVDVLEGRVRDASPDGARLGLARRLLGQDLVDADTLADALSSLDEMPTDLELARRLAEAGALDTALLGDLAREQVVDALFELLRWTDGGFRFEAGTTETRGPSILDLALPVDDVLEEVGRRLEAHAAIDERTGSADAVVTISRPGRERPEVGLSPEGWTLLALVDGHRTVGDLVRLSGQGDYRTRRTLASLMDEGIVSVGDPDSLPPGERLLSAHRTLQAHEDRLAGAEGAPTPAGSTVADVVEAPGPADDVAPTDVVEEAVGPTDAPEEAPGPADPAAPADVVDATAEATGPTEAAEATEADGEADRSTEEGQTEDGVAAPRPADAPPPGVTSLRARARAPRLRTDPDVDEDVVQRLIDGVESL
jgi:hypothetical protein